MLAGIAVVGALPWLSAEIMFKLRQQAQPWQWLVLVGLVGGSAIARFVPAIAQPSPGPVRAAVGQLVKGLIFLDAAACFAGAGAKYAILIAVLVLPSIVVSRWVQS